jgi:hypothetical protein
MIELMQEYSGTTAVLIGTIIYVLGNWMGRNHNEELIDNVISNTVTLTTETVVNNLIDDGYICCREEERDGKIISFIVPYEEYIALHTDK